MTASESNESLNGNHRTLSQVAFEAGGRLLFMADAPRRTKFEESVTQAFDELALKEDVYFVQIGAFDGYHDDPLHKYIQSPHWHGVMVEPQPEAAIALRHHYHYRPDIDIVRTAISEDQTVLKLWRPGQTTEPNLLAKASSSQRRTKHSLMRAVGLAVTKDLCFQQLTARAETLENVITDAQLPQIDVFITDTEGADFEIMRSLLKLAQPTVILYEHLHMSLSQRRKLKKELRKIGYKITTSHKDTLAVVQ